MTVTRGQPNLSGCAAPGPLSRRELLQATGLGFGSLALACLLQSEAPADEPRTDLRPRTGHFPARARAVIQLMQNGGPSQMDLFDRKPELQKRGGQTLCESVETFQKGNSSTLLPSPFRFHRRGQCGMELSEVLPHLGTVADEITLVRSMYTEHNNHTEALVMMGTGKIFQGRPSLGAWVSYALGTENQNLPAYVVLRDPAGYNNGGPMLWENGWLPALYRGTEIRARGDAGLKPHPPVAPPPGVPRNNLDPLARPNEEYHPP